MFFIVDSLIVVAVSYLNPLFLKYSGLLFVFAACFGEVSFDISLNGETVLIEGGLKVSLTSSPEEFADFSSRLRDRNYSFE